MNFPGYATSRPRRARRVGRPPNKPIEPPKLRKAAPVADGTPRRTLAISLADAEKIFGISLEAARDRYGRLTERQRQVADLMAQGKPNSQIAEELGISPKTLDIHRADVMHKLEADTVARVANIVNLLRQVDAAS